MTTSKTTIASQCFPDYHLGQMISTSTPVLHQNDKRSKPNDLFIVIFDNIDWSFVHPLVKNEYTPVQKSTLNLTSSLIHYQVRKSLIWLWWRGLKYV